MGRQYNRRTDKKRKAPTGKKRSFATMATETKTEPKTETPATPLSLLQQPLLQMPSVPSLPHFPHSGAIRWPCSLSCRLQTRLAGRSRPPIFAQQKYHRGVSGLALLARFLHRFRTLAQSYCHRHSYIDARGHLALLQLAAKARCNAQEGARPQPR